MGQVGKYLRRTQSGYAHWCPACNEMHCFAVERPQANGARWAFDGNIESPSFSPSMNITARDPEEGNELVFCCHYFLKAGQIQFLPDCTHDMKGTTVSLPELPLRLRTI